jgi:hypothetical protein
MTAATPELKYSSMPGPSVRVFAARTLARDLFPRRGCVSGERSLRPSARRAVTVSADPGGLTGDCPNARERAQQQRDRD